MEVSWVSHLRLRAVGSRDGPGSVTGLVSGRRGQPRHARPTAPARTTLGWSMHSSPPSHSCFPGGGGLQPAPGARASALCLSASPPCTITPDLRLGPMGTPSVPVRGGTLVPGGNPRHPSRSPPPFPHQCQATPSLPSSPALQGAHVSGHSLFPLDLCSPPHLNLDFLEMRAPLLGSPTSCCT